VLTFRVSGKPGFEGRADLRLTAVDIAGASRQVVIKVSVSNQSMGFDSSITYEEALALSQFAEGEGSLPSSSSSDPSSSSSSYIDEQMTLAAGDSLAKEPHSTFYQPVSPEDTATLEFRYGYVRVVGHSQLVDRLHYWHCQQLTIRY
jgi:hypothetical protein